MNKYRKLYNQFHNRYLSALDSKAKQENSHNKLKLDILINDRLIGDIKHNITEKETLINSLNLANADIAYKESSFKFKRKNNAILSILYSVVITMILTVNYNLSVMQYITTSLLAYLSLFGITTGIDYLIYIIKTKQSRLLIKNNDLEKEKKSLERLRSKYNQEYSKQKSRNQQLNITNDKLIELENLLKYLFNIKMQITNAEEIAMHKLGSDISTKAFDDYYTNDQNIKKILNRKKARRNQVGKNE